MMFPAAHPPGSMSEYHGLVGIEHELFAEASQSTIAGTARHAGNAEEGLQAHAIRNHFVDIFWLSLAAWYSCQPVERVSMSPT